MKIQKRIDVTGEIADANNFVGDAELKRMLLEPNIKVLHVTFEAGGRTNWHTHSDSQLIVIVEGTCWAQRKDGVKEELNVGDVALFEAGEVHWHGASNSSKMIHMAINLGQTTDWDFDPVSDDDYLS